MTPLILMTKPRMLVVWYQVPGTRYQGASSMMMTCTTQAGLLQQTESHGCSW
jgi:hypothetical protein